MTAENSVQFKAYLIQNAAEPEIRKFSIARDAVACYVYLKQKLEVIYPSLRESPFIISWKDSEGDLVQIWSDEELIIALSEMPEDCKKIYVVPGPMSRGLNNPGQNKHVGVVCDGCEKDDIVGFRYKCAFCPDFDLCEECEAKKMHSEHFMIRIPNPSHRDLEFGKKMMKEFFKLNKHAMKAECKRGGSLRHRPGHHKFTGGCPFVPPKAQSCPSNDNEMQGEPCTNQSGPSWFNQGTAMNFESIVDSIMQGIMMMAGEMADPPTKEKSSSQEQNEKQSDSNKPNIPQKEVKFSQNVDNSNKEDSKSEFVSSVTPSTSYSKTTMSEMEQEPLDNSWTVLNKVNGNEQKEIPKNVQTLKSDLMNAGGDSQPLYPQMHQQQMNMSQQANIDPKQKKVEESLKKMLSMGFNNEGDFLRQVLTAKNGDIEQVLDMLLPSRRNSPN